MSKQSQTIRSFDFPEWLVEKVKKASKKGTCATESTTTTTTQNNKTNNLPAIQNNNKTPHFQIIDGGANSAKSDAASQKAKVEAALAEMDINDVRMARCIVPKTFLHRFQSEFTLSLTGAMRNDYCIRTYPIEGPGDFFLVLVYKDKDAANFFEAEKLLSSNRVVLKEELNDILGFTRQGP